MKKITALLFLVSILISMGKAQEQQPIEKKVAFGENGRMYVNKELGLYLWLSTSPDKNTSKHRLLSESTSKYSNPMFFDTEGYNTLRSPSEVDPDTRKTVYPLQDIIFEVYADGRPPVTKLIISSGKTIYHQGKLFYGNGDVIIKLPANDGVSGVLKTYLSINGANYTEITDTFRLTAEGETILKYYSTDKVGNRENPVLSKFVIDNTAPKTTYELIGNKNDEDVSVNAVIKLNSADNLAGVKAIFYKINNGKQQVYTEPVIVKQFGTGGTISFYAIDYLNNTEEIQIIDEKKIKTSN